MTYGQNYGTGKEHISPPKLEYLRTFSFIFILRTFSPSPHHHHHQHLLQLHLHQGTQAPQPQPATHLSLQVRQIVESGEMDT